MKTETKSSSEKNSAFIDSHSTINVLYNLAKVSLCLCALSALFRLFALLFNSYNQMKFAYNGRQNTF
jgi:hypothetical protein